jgi:hypothetical protein
LSSELPNPLVILALALIPVLVFTPIGQQIGAVKPGVVVPVTFTTSLAIAVPVTGSTVTNLAVIQTGSTSTQYVVYTTTYVTVKQTTSYYTTATTGSSTSTSTNTGISTSTQGEGGQSEQEGGGASPPNDNSPPNDIGNQIDKYGWSLIREYATSLDWVIPLGNNQIVEVNPPWSLVILGLALFAVLGLYSERRKS